VQKGRLFQQEHPDVPVIVDKGRFLLVELSPQQARTMDKGAAPCYAIRPLSDDRVVFQTRAPALARAGAVPWVQDLVNRIARPTFEADLTHLAQLPTRFSTSSSYGQASAWARSSLAALGYSFRRQSITVGSGKSWNVIADKVGGGPAPRGVVLVTAHLDSINLNGPSAPAPGADDDGSGSAGALEIARALKDHPAAHDIRIVLFGGEEQGLFGSKQYVASLSVAERKRIRAVVHMDMIGKRNTPTPSVLLEGASLSQSVINGLAEAAATYTSLQVQTSLNPFNSDHVSFINANVPAVLTIEGADDANENVHTANDTLNTIDYDLAMQILRMNTAFIATSLGRR